MFKWYHTSAVCIIHLSQAIGTSGIGKDLRFSRGWTLQELLALVARTGHYPSNSALQNDKENTDIMDIVSGITYIDLHNLYYFNPGLFNVREKMHWASTRKTTRVEDIAYSLLSVLDISMPIARGEGKRAFGRFMEVIVNNCREWEIFAWEVLIRHMPLHSSSHRPVSML